MKPIEEQTIHKFFGLAGKIKQVHIGEYKNKANNNRKRRTVHFALVSYKAEEDCRRVLSDPKVFQALVNKVMRKTVKYSSNPFAADDVEVSDEEDEGDKT